MQQKEIGGEIYVDHGPPNLNPELEEAEDIDEGFVAREFASTARHRCAS